MKRFSTFMAMALAMWATQTALAQSPTQTIRGIVVDKQTTLPLIGATVTVLTASGLGASTDEQGRFKVAEVPVGRHDLRVSYIGYDEVTVPSVVVVAGRESVLEIGLEEAVVQAAEVVVTATTKKNETNNELATISAKSFNLEEVTRFSGGRQDAARMVANFAGVSTSNDSRNDIVIRGNSPTGVQWRMEGVPIPNPNHYSTLGTTGGPVNALNTNLLKKSDFLTSAFPAEYGNATAGIFDIRLRNGNDEQLEFMGQIGFNGFEGLVEGPLNRAKNGSFVASYRYSVIGLLGSLVDIGTNGIPEYQDFSFKVNLGSGKRGSLSAFGLWGKSDIAFYAKETAEDDFYNEPNQDSYAGSDIGIVGITGNLILGNQTYWKTTVAGSFSRGRYDVDSLARDTAGNLLPDDVTRIFVVRDVTNRLTVNSFLNHKFNAKHTLRAGIQADLFGLDLSSEIYRTNLSRWEALRDFEDGLGVLEVYGQSQYKMSEKWTLNTGLHLQYLTLNDNFVAEPRLALNWAFAPKQRLNLGYGLHHQMQPLPVYFYQSFDDNGAYQLTNKDLKFTQSHHVVLGYDASLAEDWRFKAEAYYQYLDKVPVDADSSSFSVLNTGSDFAFPEAANLVNEGTGFNYGMELTLEKYYSKGYYGLLTVTLYDSKYKGSDGIERNTAFNNSYIVNLLAGKEFPFGRQKQNVFTLDFRLSRAGGRYYTPVDLEASQNYGSEVLDNERAFSERFDDYFRADIKFGYRMNTKKISQTFSVDLQNVFDTQNVFLQSYSPARGEVVTTYQLGFFPDVTYRIQF